MIGVTESSSRALEGGSQRSTTKWRPRGVRGGGGGSEFGSRAWGR